MSTFENLILQWINCLLDANNCIKTIEDLEDYQVLYKLINKVKLWNLRNHNVNYKDMVIEFLNDEYPYFVISRKIDNIENLYITLLILSRLSLEPIFHKSLCNLQLEMQIKIKSILESLYTLGKKVTAEDLHRIFSLSDKNDVKLSFKKPKHVLEEFLTSPITRSVQSDHKMFEQLKQIRHLRAELETARYEKSELVEDIKNQEKQINELQCKLQETLIELKALRAENFKSRDSNGSIQERNKKTKDSSYKKEIESLEKYVSQLQNENCQLQDEKNDLIIQIKTCKIKLCELEEKYLNNEQILESITFQLEKKDEELTEIKLRHDEMCNYLKESTKNLNNQSFEADESKLISEMSIIKSEPLSSVIEIQLEETKKEMINAYNKSRYMETLTTIILEEYIKLKNKVTGLSKKLNDKEKHVVNEMEKEKDNHNEMHSEQSNITSEELYNLIQNQYVITELENNCSFIVRDEIKKAFIQIFRDDLKILHERSLFLNISSKTDNKLPKNNIKFDLQEKTNGLNPFLNYDDSVQSNENLTLLNTSKALQSYQGSTEINQINETKLSLNFAKILSQPNWTNELMCIFKVLFHDLKTEVNSEKDKNDLSIVKSKNRYLIQQEISEVTEIICKTIFHNSTVSLNSAETDSEIMLFSRDELELLQTSWSELYKSIFNNFKICKVLVFLEKSWSFTIELLKNMTCDDYSKIEFRELVEKKDVIQNEMKNINNQNMQHLSSNLISAIEFVTILNKYCNKKIDFTTEVTATEKRNDLSLLKGNNKYNLQQQNNICSKVGYINRQMNDFYYLVRCSHETKKISDNIAPTILENEIKSEMKDVECQVHNESLLYEDKHVASEFPAIDQVKKIYVDNFCQFETDTLDVECQVHNESLEPDNYHIPVKAETLDVECQVHNESLEPDNSQMPVKPEALDFGCQVDNESLETDSSHIPVKAETLDVECQVHNESLEPDNSHIPVKTETLDVECQVHNESLEPDNSQIPVKPEALDFGCQVHNESLETDSSHISVKAETLDVECQVHNESLEPDNSHIPVKTETLDVECQVHNESLEPDNSQIPVKPEALDFGCQVHNESLETDNSHIPVKAETLDMECQVRNESLEPDNYSQIHLKTKMLDYECQVDFKSLGPISSSENQVKIEMLDVESQVHNESLEPDNSQNQVKIEMLDVECQVHNESLEPDNTQNQIRIEMLDVECQVHNESLEPDHSQIAVKIEMSDVECQVHNESLESIIVNAADTPKMDQVIEITQVKSEVKDAECQVHSESLLESEDALDEKPHKHELSTKQEVQTKTSDITLRKNENLQERAKPSIDELNAQFQKHLMEVHEKYEMKLEKMKEKMKSAFNNQVAAMRKEQEAASVRLEEKLEKQCHGHADELKKYNRHISELSTQLWDVGEKLIIERQKNDDLLQKLKSSRLKFENLELHNARRESIRRESEMFHEPPPPPLPRKEKEKENIMPPLDTSLHKIQSVRGFQIMGNAFRNEDEEGELFDTTYLADMQQQRSNNSSICAAGPDVDRLSILQLRNAKCRPHLKSSYPAEMAFHPAPVSEDEIKTGQPEEVFNDSLSQSLLTGKKVKRSNRTRTTGGSETPRKSRRFSNIFRKPRLSLDRNKLP